MRLTVIVVVVVVVVVVMLTMITKTKLFFFTITIWQSIKRCDDMRSLMLSQWKNRCSVNTIGDTDAATVEVESLILVRDVAPLK